MWANEIKPDSERQITCVSEIVILPLIFRLSRELKVATVPASNQGERQVKELGSSKQSWNIGKGVGPCECFGEIGVIIRILWRACDSLPLLPVNVAGGRNAFPCNSNRALVVLAFPMWPIRKDHTHLLAEYVSAYSAGSEHSDLPASHRSGS
jgi:hypothetical protein